MAEDMKEVTSDMEEGDYDDIDDLDGLEDDDMLDSSSLFWKLKIPIGNEPAEITEPSIPGYVIHITKASFGVNVKSNSRTVILCNNAEDDEYVPICVLKENQAETVALDLIFGETAFLKVGGSKPCDVWLTGYLQPAFNDTEQAFPSLDDLEDDDDLDMEDDGSQPSPSIETSPQKKRKLNNKTAQPQTSTEAQEVEQLRTRKVPTKSLAKQALPTNEATQSQSQSESESTQGKKKKNKKKKNKNKNKNKNEQSPKTAETNETNIIVTKTTQEEEEVNKTEEKKQENGGKSPKDSKDAKDTTSVEQSQSSKKKKKNKMKKGAQGIEFKDLREGKGDRIAKKNDTLRVHYIGQLENQQIFDKNIAGDGLKFKLGAGQVVKGWDLGLQGIKVGGKRKLWIPAKLGYGSDAQEKIPPNSKLVFTVECKEIS